VLQYSSTHTVFSVCVCSLDPLNRYAKPEVPELDPTHYGLAMRNGYHLRYRIAVK